jgi:hypothetical protein
MLSAEERESIVNDAVRYLAGDKDDDAENAYFGITEGTDPETSWSLLSQVATRSSEVADASDIGAGLLESFIIRYGSTHPGLIADGIIGNARLLAAVSFVRGLHRHPALIALLPVGIGGAN